MLAAASAQKQRRPAFDTNVATKKRLRSFSFWSHCCYCGKIIAALAVAFLLVVSSFHLPAGLGDAQPEQARRLAAAAAAAAAEPACPAFFLVGRGLHPGVRHQLVG